MMKHALVIALMSLVGLHEAFAADDTSQFAQAGINQANSSVNANTGQKYVPNYTYNADEEKYYKDGMGNITVDGNNKKQKCEGMTSGTRQEMTECDAINFVNKNPTSRPLYVIDPQKDAMIQDSNKVKKLSAEANAKKTNCFVKETKTGAKYKNEQCLVTRSYSTAKCTEQEVIDKCPALENNMECGGKGGIALDSVKNTVSNESSFTLKDGVLELRMGGGGGNGERNTEFTLEIEDVSKTEIFHMYQFYHDDGIQLDVNGTNLISHSWGSATSGYQSADMDIRPYLKNGVNTFKLRNYNNRKGWASVVWFKVKMACYCTTKIVSSCQKLENTKESLCTKEEEICTATKNGKCVSKEKRYSCLDPINATDCDQYAKKGCSQTKSECLTKDNNGKCISYSQTYSCQTSKPTVKKETICVDATCVDGSCFNGTSPEDKDFAQGVAMMEVTREAGIYGEGNGTGTLSLFKGTDETCTVKLLGGHNIMSCCKEVKVDASKSTNKETGSKETQAFGNDPSKPAQPTEGSTYQYDDLYNDDSKTQQQLQSTLTVGWLQCTKEERELGVRRGSNLCVLARTWCSEKKPVIGCVEESRAWCCFKSILAKLVNRQGREQLGLPLSSCDGFTIEQLQKLDFSKMDLTEFKESIVPANIDLDKRKKEIEQQVTKQVSEGYYSE